MKFLSPLAAAAALTGLAVPAHAEPAGIDVEFLTALGKAGITFRNAEKAVAAGRTACELMDSGQPELDVVKRLTEENPGFTVSGAAKFTAIAASAYCPQHLNVVSGPGGSDNNPPSGGP
ncbi:hypothetical protein MSP7336_03971 [Mycobacterium shimoidei]|uniref:DUF732 domain-containing protein n=1 Tax=Mycobacterium shimoidei TaxID=29313 RepID=A0A375Z3F4_MYCSH|nr:DUF732 domain-containing protein [Mycobacterium shimoidei]SRX95698.1 hypothetical protein MSP7336_03971 [Mycobacterium shimoidei]